MGLDGSDLESQEDYGGDCDSPDEGYDAVWTDGDDDLDLDDVDGCCNVEEEVIGNHGKENFTVLNGEIIRRRIEKEIEEISTVLSVAKQDAIILLCRYNWAVTKIHEDWFADEDKVRKDYGLWGNQGFVSAKRDFFCGICFEDYRLCDDQGIALAASCGHVFCLGCWETYVRIAINDGFGCLMLTCPQPKCAAAVGKDIIELLVCDVDEAKYWNYIVRSFVENRKSGNIKWCPAPGCDFAVECDEGVVSGGRSLNVTCNCSHGFCWNCLEEAHSPTGCEIVAQWILKNNSEEENTKWILANSKPCPKCRRSIEKNHGCMHMTCTPPCRFQFCWLCLGPWSEHGDSTGGYYSCNGYEKGKREGKYEEDEFKRQAAKSYLDRYTHYFERWAANNSSRNTAIKDMNMTKTENLANLGGIQGKPETQLEFIIDAWSQIVECRRFLKWTYAYGYYLPQDELAKVKFFECIQGEAEAALERLHKYTEEKLKEYLKAEGPSEDFTEFRIKLIDMTIITRNYFDKFARELENGPSDLDTRIACLVI